MTSEEMEMLSRGLQAQKRKKKTSEEPSKWMKVKESSSIAPGEGVPTPETMVPLTILSLPAKVSHQLIINIKMINVEKAKASKVVEETQGYKADVSHL
ncbi:hypothetical protein COCNU_scaffold006352G000010 [Cocos nucifera]|nr:hypothetical protein [Cocos nucifera]